MGGTIMGIDAADSVTNSYGQTHEIPNLWIAGLGIFPTSGAPNPTYTIYALSLRGAEQLAKNWAMSRGNAARHRYSRACPGQPIPALEQDEFGLNRFGIPKSVGF